MQTSLIDWIKNNNLNVQEDNLVQDQDIGPILRIENKYFYPLYNNDEKIITLDPNTDKLILELTSNQIEDLDIYSDLCDDINILFCFGNLYYYTPYTEECEVEFNLFRYIGNAVCDLDSEFNYSFAHLGCHTEYELLSGVCNARDYVNKANFYQVKTLGIIDKNTLAGTLAFQEECKKQNIKSIIGETITVLYDNRYEYDCICYVVNEQGWRNLLTIDSIVNDEREQNNISEEEFLKYTKGLICCFGGNSIIHSDIYPIERIRGFVVIYQQYFEQAYYALDSVEFVNDKIDIKNLEYIKRYKDELSDILYPILINNSYYLEQEHHSLYKNLNDISKRSISLSYNQHFKNVDETFSSFGNILSDSGIDFITRAIQNQSLIYNTCNFTIDTKTFKLPTYESKQDNEDLFYDLLSNNLIKKVGHKKNFEEYVDRLEKESSVIANAGFIDYFLILWDICNWARNQEIQIGLSRGSAGGCLILYLLGITQIDPLEYDLLFERFLNEGRIESGELPDVDVDFQANRRDEVKQYIIDKYGKEYVCYVGTYNRLKLKSAIKDFARLKGIKFSYVNYITSKIEDKPDYEWKDIFYYALKDKKVYSFVQKYGDIIENIQHILNNVKIPSIHASAMIIVPKRNNKNKKTNIFQWFPTKNMDGYIVSQWEGKYVETARFLKEDILSINQLNKFDEIRKLVKKHNQEEINVYNINLNDRNVYKLFTKGLNEDVFQFGTFGLQKYSKEVRPSSIHDLIAMVALHRPGPMESKAHIEYVQIKHGQKEPSYDYGTEHITQDTLGLYIYQEQIMQVANQMGGFTLAEGDALRKAMGKKIKEKMDQYEKQFLQQAIDNNYPESEVKKIWDKMKEFAKYGFNKSHATAYAITGYISQYLKYHYPLEFWTVSLNESSDAEVREGYTIMSARLNEISRLNLDITISSVDINQSTDIFTCNKDTQTIYWSLSKVKHCGASAIEAIINERKQRGNFYSLDEFISRIEKAKVNKRKIASLIVSGAFDSVEEITNPRDRKKLLIKYFKEYYNESIPDEFDIKDNDIVWILLQKETCGFGEVDYKQLIPNNALHAKYRSATSVLNEKRSYVNAAVAGKVIEVQHRETRKGDPFAKLILLDNNELVRVMIWKEFYTTYEEILNRCTTEKDIMLAISGVVRYDTYQKCNTLHSNETTKIYELN